MGRVLLVGVVLLVLPAVIWLAWQYRGAGLRPVGFLEQRLRAAPWPWLLGIGLVMAIAVLLLAGSFDKADCERVPSRYVDGKLIEAHCR